MEKLTKKNSILYNQLWINKAIEEGYIEFLPVHKIPNKSIGEHIELKYKQLYNEEFNRYYRNGCLNDYEHLISDTPKVTKRSSLLFTREWLLKAKEEGMYIPNRKICLTYSIGEILELKYFEKMNLIENQKPDEFLYLSGEKNIRKKVKK